MHVEQVGAAQLLGHGDRVGGLALPVQRLDRLVDVAVRRLVEVAGLDVRLDRGGDRVAREQHRAEQRLLGLEVVRRHPSARASTHRFDRLDHCRSHSPPPLRPDRILRLRARHWKGHKVVGGVGRTGSAVHRAVGEGCGHPSDTGPGVRQSSGARHRSRRQRSRPLTGRPPTRIPSCGSRPTIVPTRDSIHRRDRGSPCTRTITGPKKIRARS